MEQVYSAYCSVLYRVYVHEPASHPLKCEVQRFPLLSSDTKITVLSCYTSPFDEVRNAAKAQLHAALQSHFNYKLLFYIYTDKKQVFWNISKIT